MEELPEIPPQDRVETDRWLVQHEEPGLAEQCGRKRDARSFTAREAGDDSSAVLVESHLGQHAFDHRLRLSEHASEEHEVLAHGEVAVDRRRLGHVADTRAQRRRAGGIAEHRNRAAGNLLDAHDRAHESRLAAAARPQKAGHRTGGNFTAQARQYHHATPNHAEVLDADRRRGHPPPADIARGHIRSNSCLNGTILGCAGFGRAGWSVKGAFGTAETSDEPRFRGQQAAATTTTSLWVALVSQLRALSSAAWRSLVCLRHIWSLDRSESRAI